MRCQGNSKELCEVAEGGLRLQNFNNSCSGDLIIGVLEVNAVADKVRSRSENPLYTKDNFRRPAGERMSCCGSRYSLRATLF